MRDLLARQGSDLDGRDVLAQHRGVQAAPRPPGEEGATGDFQLRINSDEEIICCAITLSGVTGDDRSPAITATHSHEAAAGAAGPPRVAFPNPEGSGDTRTSEGCLQGPFATGVLSPEGVDTGTGFTLAQIEADPAAFTGDSHTVDFAPGVVRGQLEEAETEASPEATEASPEAAAGASDDEAAGPPIALIVGIVAVLAAIAVVAVVVVRRRGAQRA